MKEASISDIAYQLKRNQQNKQPGAIVFIGAGASVTSGIPSADKIAENILEKYGDIPGIKKLVQDKKHYHELMGCLTPYDRKVLLNEYIRNAKINVTHIYLAHLMVCGFVDYIVTVNFDNLTLRALALFNQFPATYDISILKEITTTSFDKPAVIFMHGQHHGLWQLNTDEEMAKIGQTVPHIFRSIANQRPWIVVGYGASDPVFKYLVELGRFDNNLYWIGYKTNEPAKNVKEDLLDRSNSNASWVKGYDSDLFFLELHTELKLEQPDIFSKPFSHIKKLHESIIDIQDDKLKVVQERLRITGQQIKDAIANYETGISDKVEEESKKGDVLQLEIIDKYLKNDFASLPELEKKVFESPASESYLHLISDFYVKWGNAIADIAETKTGKEAESFYLKAIELYKKGIGIKPDNGLAYYNWGNVLADLAETKTGKETESLYQEAIGIYRKSIEVRPDDPDAYYNLGNTLSNLADTKAEKEAESFYLEAIEMFKKALVLRPNDVDIYYNWGNTLFDLADTKTGKEAETLYLDAIEMYKRIIQLKPDYGLAYYNWGNVLVDLAENKPAAEATRLFLESIEHYKKTIELKPDYAPAYDSWGNSLISLSKIEGGVKGNELLEQSISILRKAYVIGPFSYNLACAYALSNQKPEAFHYLDVALKNKEMSVEEVNQDADWSALRNENDFIELINKYKPTN